jgi:serine/threonine protein kinase
MIFNDAKFLQNSEIGTYLRDFKLIGHGGFGVVYQAHHTVLNRKVAVKIMRTGLEGTEDSTVATRFLREARALSQLEHPNIARIYTFGHTEGQPYIVLEYLEGKTLTDVLKAEGPLSLERTKSMFSAIAGAVSEIHAHKLIHRDLSSNNCMILTNDDGSETVKVFDFGLVKDIGVSDGQKLTKTREVCGTLQYMSPEGCSGKPLDERSDVYSLGCLLYQMFGGKPPFSEPDLVALMWKQAHEIPAPVYITRHDNIAYPELERAIEKSLAKHPNDRFQSIRDFNEAVQDVRITTPAGSYRRAARNTFNLPRKLVASAFGGILAIVICLCFFGNRFISAPDLASEVNRLQLKLERLDIEDRHALQLELAHAKTRLSSRSGSAMSGSEALVAWEKVLETCSNPDELITIAAESDSLKNVGTKQLQRVHAVIMTRWQPTLNVPVPAKSLSSARLQCRDIVDAQTGRAEASASSNLGNSKPDSVLLSMCEIAVRTGQADHAWLPYTQYLKNTGVRNIEFERKILRDWIQFYFEHHRLSGNKPLCLRLGQLSFSEPPGSIDHLCTLSMLSRWPGDVAYASRYSRECENLIKTRSYPDSSKLADVLLNLGTDALRQQNHLKAKSYLEQSRRILLALGDIHGGLYGNLEYSYSLLLMTSGQPQAATQAIENAARAYGSLRAYSTVVTLLVDTANQLPSGSTRERDRLLNLALSYGLKEKDPKQRTESFAKIARALAEMPPTMAATNSPTVLLSLQKYADWYRDHGESVSAGPLFVRQAEILHRQKKFQAEHNTVITGLTVVSSSPVVEWLAVDRAYSALERAGAKSADLNKAKHALELRVQEVLGKDQESQNQRACLHALLGYTEKQQKNYLSSTEHFRKAILNYKPSNAAQEKTLALWQSNFLTSSKAIRTLTGVMPKPILFSDRELTAQFDLLQQLAAEYDRDGLVDAQLFTKTRIADIIAEIARTDKNRAAILYGALANSYKDLELFADAERIYDAGLRLMANDVNDTRKILLMYAMGNQTDDSKRRKLIAEGQSVLVLDAARSRPVDIQLASTVERTQVGLGQMAAAAEIVHRIEALATQVTDRSLQKEIRNAIRIHKLLTGDSDAIHWFDADAAEATWIYVQNGEIDKAISNTKKFATAPNMPPQEVALLLMDLGNFYILNLNPAEAEQSYKKAADILYTHQNLVLGRHRLETARLGCYALAQDHGHYQCVLKYLQKEQNAGKLKASYIPQIARTEALYARLRGQVAEATSRYTQLQRTTPSNDVLVGLGLCELSNKNFSAAERHLRKALLISRRPAPAMDSLNEASAFLGLADLSLQRHAPQGAIEFLKQARWSWSRSSPLGRQVLSRWLNVCARHTENISDPSQKDEIRKLLSEFRKSDPQKISHGS